MIDLPNLPLDLDDVLSQIEKALILEALAKTKTKMAAAKVLGIGWRSMRYRLEKYGIAKSIANV